MNFKMKEKENEAMIYVYFMLTSHSFLTEKVKQTQTKKKDMCIEFNTTVDIK